jgi:hypothetical protein
MIPSLLDKWCSVAGGSIAMASPPIHSATPADGLGPLVALWPGLHPLRLRVGALGCTGLDLEVYRELSAVHWMCVILPVWCPWGVMGYTERFTLSSGPPVQAPTPSRTAERFSTRFGRGGRLGQRHSNLDRREDHPPGIEPLPDSH